MNKTLSISSLATLLLLSACGGADGLNGADGQSCQVSSVAISPEAPNGGSLLVCSHSQSLILNGTNGTNGTAISERKFCPGVTTYPSRFVEVGFVVGGKLYAVYSANGGLLTEIPPGAYNSAAIGSTCNFTVNANLSITN